MCILDRSITDCLGILISPLPPTFFVSNLPLIKLSSLKDGVSVLCLFLYQCEHHHGLFFFQESM